MTQKYLDTCVGPLPSPICHYPPNPEQAEGVYIIEAHRPFVLPVLNCTAATAFDILRTSDTLPRGLSLSDNGTISGKPEELMKVREITVVPWNLRGVGPLATIKLAVIAYLCPAGSYCPEPDSPVECPAGSYCNENSITFTKCSLGSFCPAGSAFEQDCPEGWYCSTPKDKLPCSDDGTFCPPRSNYQRACLRGNYCPTNYEQYECAEGDHCPDRRTVKTMCPERSYCGKVRNWEIFPCDMGFR